MSPRLSSAAAVLCLLASGSSAFVAPSGEAGVQRSSALHAERRDFFSQVATTVGAGLVAGNVLGGAVEPANALGGLNKVNAKLSGCVRCFGCSRWFLDCRRRKVAHVMLTTDFSTGIERCDRTPQRDDYRGGSRAQETSADATQPKIR